MLLANGDISSFLAKLIGNVADWAIVVIFILIIAYRVYRTYTEDRALRIVESTNKDLSRVVRALLEKVDSSLGEVIKKIDHLIVVIRSLPRG